MFHKLHIQLTALCTAVTALTLTVLTIICLCISESGMQRQEYASFLTSLNTLYQNLQSQSIISHSLIRQIEDNYDLSMQILDNGNPLFFQELDRRDSQSNVFTEISETAAREYGLDINNPSSLGVLAQHVEFTFDCEHETVFASAALIPRTKGNLSILVFHSLRDIRQRMVRQRILFLFSDLTALLLLAVFFWFFTARMIHPLQESRRKQAQFISAASHELRSPLAVIRSNLEAVKSGSMEGDRQFLDTIDEEGQRMARLIDDMLQLANADSHSWQMQMKPTELDTLLLETWEYYEPMAHFHQLRWEISLPEDNLPPVSCDGERIRQLLAILIDNAFSYTPSGGKVGLSLNRQNSAVSILVSDSGPGIPDTEKEAVFDRFYRSDPSRNSKNHYGLGLSIAKEITVLHRGHIQIKDTPGGGATFVVTLNCP